MAEPNERAALAQASEDVGWARRVDGRVDIYRRGAQRVRVIWRGDAQISGGSRFSDGMLETYSRQLPTVKNWLV